MSEKIYSNDLVEDMGMDELTFQRLKMEIEEIIKDSKTMGEVVERYVKNMNLMEKELIVKGYFLHKFILEYRD